MKTFGLRTFRAVPSAWMGELVLPFVFFSVLAVVAVDQTNLPVLIAVFGMLGLALFVAFKYVLPMVRTWIDFDRSTLEGGLNGQRFRLYYSEIQAAWMAEQRRRRYLYLVTNKGTVCFPLNFFDAGAVWEELSLRMPKDRLGEDGMRRLPVFRDKPVDRNAMPPDESAAHLVPDNWIQQVLGWGGLVICGFSSISGVVEKNYPAAIIFGLIGLVSVGLVMRWGITEFAFSHVRRSTLFNSYSIMWNEVKWIEQDPLGLCVVLCGNSCRLAIPGPAFWSSMRRKLALEVFHRQAAQRQIPVRRTIMAVFKLSHRTRMAR